MPATKVCERPDCGRSFTQARANARFCSLQCRGVMAARRRNGTPLDGVHHLVCRQCGRSFDRKGRPTSFCSNTCRDRADKAARPSNPVQPVTCGVCGTTFVPPFNHARRKYCTSCVRDHQLARTREYGRARFAANHNTVLDERLMSKYRYGLQPGAAFDPTVTPTAVLARYGPTCQHCGRALYTMRDRAASQRPDAMTIDHRFPISKGGDHTWKNVVLSCRACNNSKGDDVCQSCGGAITTIGEPVCATCEAKGRGPKVRYGVCSQCGFVELPGGFCSRCKAKGPGLWAATGLTRVEARKLSRSLGHVLWVGWEVVA